MSDFTKFRSTLGGFNRTDVSAYIEKVSAQHQDALQQCHDEAAALQTQLEQAQENLERLEADNEALRSQLAEKDALLEELTAPTQQPETPDYPQLELEAYRRAEAAERLAAERAMRVRNQVDDLLENISNRCTTAGQEIQALTEDIRTNLQRLEDTLSELDVAFAENSEAFQSLDGTK